jgi:transposase-like protein
MAMKKQEMQQLLALLGRLTGSQRKELASALKAQTSAEASIEVLESAGSQARSCPHCKSERLVRNGMADMLQRHKCRACGKTFNALTGTPLARLRHKGKWLEQTRAMSEGLTVHRAAAFPVVAPSTAFRWRHRFLGVPRGVKLTSLAGVAEMDEAHFLESYKGRKVVGRAPRKRGGRAAKRGTSREQIPVLVARDRSGVTTDYEVLAVGRDMAIQLGAAASTAGRIEVRTRLDGHDSLQVVEPPVHAQSRTMYSCSRHRWRASRVALGQRPTLDPQLRIVESYA